MTWHFKTFYELAIFRFCWILRKGLLQFVDHAHDWNLEISNVIKISFIGHCLKVLKTEMQNTIKERRKFGCKYACGLGSTNWLNHISCGGCYCPFLTISRIPIALLNSQCLGMFERKTFIRGGIGPRPGRGEIEWQPPPPSCSTRADWISILSLQSIFILQNIMP